MEKNKTVTINGHLYDAVTGMPVSEKSVKKVATSEKKPVVAAGVHAAVTQRSQTLNRRIAKKNAPSSAKRPTQGGRSMDISRSNRIARFAPHPVAGPEPSKRIERNRTADARDHAPVSHPMAHRALARSHAKQFSRGPVATVMAPVSKTPKQVKEEAIASALAAPTIKAAPPKKKSFFSRHSRKLTVIITSLIVVLVGGYLTLVNMPTFSVWIAATQSGVKATYPDYQPDGYSLSQPVTFSEGEVTLNFVSNGGSGGYVIKEENSTWDSSAVLEKIVKKQAGDNYITTQDSGLTIYTFAGNAAWVNGGILYTITTTAPLSNEQVRNIASSL